MRKPPACLPNRLLRVVLATLVLALAPLVVAAPVQAAPSEWVEITSPADGSSGYGTDLTISGKARSATNWVYVTIPGDINVYQAYLYKGAWSVHVNEQPAGPTTICAELRGAGGSVLARDCNAFTVTADPSRFEISYPEEGAVLGEWVAVLVTCVKNTTVRLTMDAGETVELPCENWGVDRTYPGLADGSHTVTASMVDQGAVVATRTRTFTVDLPDPGTVSITSPTDGSSSYLTPVVVSGTASSWNNGVYISIDGVESAIASIDDTGRWEATLYYLGVGSHTICAATKDIHFVVDAQDCIGYTVTIDPNTLGIYSPAEGSINPPYVVVEGYCFTGTTLSLSLDGGTSTEQPCTGWFSQEYNGLADGTHTVSATMLDNGTAIATQQRSFVVDATPPAPPVVTSPSTSTTITEPTLPLVGTAEPGSTVLVLDPNEVAWYYTTAADDGSWAVTVDEVFFLFAGALDRPRTQMTVKVAAMDGFGNRSTINSYTYTVRIR